MELDKYQNKFRAEHPETGELSQGSVLSGEQAQALGQLFHDKVYQLSSKKEDLTLAEATLVDQVVDLGSRVVVMAEDREGFSLPVDSADQKKLMSSAYQMVTGSGERWPLDHAVESPSDVIAVMHGLTGGAVGMRRNPHTRLATEDYAMSIMPYLGAMVAENGGLTLDGYFAGIIQNLLNNFELAEVAQPQAV